MIDFTNVKAITIPEGAVKKITRKSDGALLWQGATYTNLIPLSIGTDKKPYIGDNGEVGYKTGIQISSSDGEEKTSLTTDAVGFIPCGHMDKFYFSKGLMPNETVNRVAIALYDENFSFLTFKSVNHIFGARTNSVLTNYGTTFYDDNSLCTIMPRALSYWVGSSVTGKTAYARFVVWKPITGNSVITKNQPIE